MIQQHSDVCPWLIYEMFGMEVHLLGHWECVDSLPFPCAHMVLGIFLGVPLDMESYFQSPCSIPTRTSQFLQSLRCPSVVLLAQQQGPSNAIGCGGGVIESPISDLMIISKLSRFNDSAPLRCSSLVNLQNFWYGSTFPWSLRTCWLITVPLCSHGPRHLPRRSTGYGKLLSESL